MLFERTEFWEPVRPPQVLGELLDSRYMLPLLFPSDPRMLAALPGKVPLIEQDKVERRRGVRVAPDSRSSSRIGNGDRGTMVWRSRNRKLREVGIGALQWVDGVRSAARWGRAPEPGDEEVDDDDNQPHSYTSDDSTVNDPALRLDTHTTPLTRKPSGRSKGRTSLGGETTPIERL